LNIFYAPNRISYKYTSLFIYLFIYICWRCAFSSSFRLYFIVAIVYFFFFFFLFNDRWRRPNGWMRSFRWTWIGV